MNINIPTFKKHAGSLMPKEEASVSKAGLRKEACHKIFPTVFQKN